MRRKPPTFETPNEGRFIVVLFLDDKPFVYYGMYRYPYTRNDFLVTVQAWIGRKPKGERERWRVEASEITGSTLFYREHGLDPHADYYREYAEQQRREAKDTEHGLPSS